MTTIKSLMTSYREYLEHERQLAKQTVTAYLSDLRTLDVFVGGKEVEAIGLDDLRAFIRDMSKRGIKTATIHRKMAGFTTFWKWLQLQHFEVEIITERLKLPKIQQKVPVWLTASEVRRFADTSDCGKGKWIRQRNQMAWKTLAWFGVRRSELLGLKVSDVHLDDKLLIVRETKSKRDRMIPIPSALLADFEAWVSGKKPDNYLFPSYQGNAWEKNFFYSAFYKHLKTCGLDGRGITPHVLRHSFAVGLRQKGVPIEVVQQLLGHKDIKTTMKYLHFGAEYLQEAMETLLSFGAK